MYILEAVIHHEPETAMYRALTLSVSFVVLLCSAVFGQGAILVQHPQKLKGQVGKPLADPVKILIAGSGIDANTCKNIKVEFQPLGGGAAAQPLKDSGQWDGVVCFVRTVWTLGQIKDQELDVRIENQPGTRIIVKAVAEPPKPTAGIQFAGGNPEPGVPSTVLSKPVKVRIIPNGAACSKYLVEFQSSGDGEAKPSTAPAVSTGTECIAMTKWKLPTFAWTGQHTETWLTATLKLDGKSHSTAATKANLVVPNGLEIDVRSPWGYVSRDLGRSISAELTFPQQVDCSTVELAFQATGEGVASPANARSDAGLSTTCSFSTRWKLGESPGKQTIRASVKGIGSISRTEEIIARAAPRIIGGLLYVPGGLAPDSSKSDSKMTVASESTADGSMTSSSSGEKRDFVALAGLDFPLAALLPRDWSGKFPPLHRVRLVAGTEFGANAFKAAYFGLNVSVAASRLATEANPISFVVGRRIQEGGDNRWWLGVAVGAEDLIGSVAAGLGLD